MAKYECFVGNVDYGVSDEHLVTIFSEVGKVIDIRLFSDAGYRVVTFEDPETARAAVALLDGRLVQTRPLQVGEFTVSLPFNAARSR